MHQLPPQLRRSLPRALPLIASVLGRKYGVQVRIGGTNACTDGTVIHLPSLPLECDDTLMGLARGYIDHESAHIRSTDFDQLKAARLSPLEHHIWNTFEDWRVERELSAVFPGCRQNFQWLIRHLFAHDTEQTIDPAMIVLNWLLLAVRTWDVPALAAQRDREKVAVDRAYPGLLDQLRPVLQRVREHTRSTRDCIHHARIVAAILAQYGEGNTATGKPQTKKGRSKKDNALHQLHQLTKASTRELPKGLGERLADHLDTKRPKNVEMALRTSVPGQKQTRELDATAMEETSKAATGLHTRLQGLLQAHTLTRCRMGRHGRLDSSQLHKIAVADPRLFRRNGETRHLNTAVHILLDCSGSMRKRIALATNACHAVASALYPIRGISVGVTAFPAGSSIHNGNGQTDDGPTVRPILGHGERLHTRFGLAASGCTPLGEALWWVMQQMLPLPETRKLILVLTDGNPDHLPLARQAIQAGESAGFEIYGLGIQSDAIQQLLPGRSHTIHDLPDLAPALFGMLQRALLTLTPNPSQ